MTVRRPPFRQARPREPRYVATPAMAAAMFAPPPLPARGAPPWAVGHLQRMPNDDLHGELRGPDGWVLALVGHAPGAAALQLLVSVETQGLLLPMADDHGLSSDMMDGPDLFWPLRLTPANGGASWLGELLGPSWMLVVTGTRAGAGRLALAATVEGAHGR